MSRNDDIEKAKEFECNIRKIQKKIESNDSQNVSNKSEKQEINLLAESWFDNFSQQLLHYGLSSEVISNYDGWFKNLLLLSAKNNRRTSYKKTLQKITKSFFEDIIIFLQTEGNKQIEGLDALDKEVIKLIDTISDKEENEYVQEAVGCWEHGYLKAATVLIWCAAMDRIHKTIEKIGFSSFNRASADMKKQTKGRYKKFNKEFCIQTENDLQEVFDKDILCVIEAMQLIDTNQKVRLTSCFNMRCHSGHPGEAPITKYNVLSCFSDIIEIILSNPKFDVTEGDIKN